MVFEKIDKNSWNRKEYFDHYFASVPCTYSMTVKVDITQIKEKGMKLYPAMLYYIAMIASVDKGIQNKTTKYGLPTY